jgi:lipoprotein signal peptidase
VIPFIRHYLLDANSESRMRTLKIKHYASMLLIVAASFTLDQLTKQAAQEHIRTWESPTDLRQYMGRSIPIFSLGENKGDPNAFFLDFNLDYVRNQGAAWGFLSDLDDHIRVPFFHIVTFFAILLIFSYFRSTPHHHRVARLGLVSIFSGAIGNFYDRITLGYVIDFLDFRWNIPLPFPIRFSMNFWPKPLQALNMNVAMESWRYNFPNFNWADSAITIGVSLLIIDMLFLERKRERAKLQKES